MVDAWALAPPGTLVCGAEVTLAEEEARHLSGALRSRVGDRVVLTDGAGIFCGGRLTECFRSRAVVRVVDLKEVEKPPEGLQLMLAVLHTKAMDWAVQKAVELGVLVFRPVVSERSQGDEAAALRRHDHWRRVADQALKQCHRVWAMEVLPPEKVRRAIATIDPGVFADAEGVPPTAIPRTACRTLLVGPEGGFSSGERADLDSGGWRKVGLGPHVLRAETAAVVGAGVLGMRLAETR